MRDRGEDFSAFVWDVVGGEPRQNAWPGKGDVPVETGESRALSKALKARGFKFVGPVIVYAWMEAVGLVNDHVVTCFRHADPRRHPAGLTLRSALGRRSCFHAVRSGVRLRACVMPVLDTRQL